MEIVINKKNGRMVTYAQQEKFSEISGNYWRRDVP